MSDKNSSNDNANYIINLRLEVVDKTLNISNGLINLHVLHQEYVGTNSDGNPIYEDTHLILEAAQKSNQEFKDDIAYISIGHMREFNLLITEDMIDPKTKSIKNNTKIKLYSNLDEIMNDKSIKIKGKVLDISTVDKTGILSILVESHDKLDGTEGDNAVRFYTLVTPQNKFYDFYKNELETNQVIPLDIGYVNPKSIKDNQIIDGTIVSLDDKHDISKVISVKTNKDELTKATRLTHNKNNDYNPKI